MKIYNEDLLLLKDFHKRNPETVISLTIFGDLILSKYLDNDNARPELKTFLNDKLILTSKENFIINQEPLRSQIINFINEWPDLFNIARLIEYSEVILTIGDLIIESREELLIYLINDFKKYNDCNVFNIYYKINNKFYRIYLIYDENLVVKDYFLKEDKNKIILIVSNLNQFFKEFEAKFVKIEPNYKFKTYEDIINSYEIFETHNVNITVKKDKRMLGGI